MSDKNKEEENLAENQESFENFDKFEDAVSAENLENKIGKTEDYLKKNKNLLTIVGVGIMAAFSAVMFYNYVNENNSKKAEAELFPAVFMMEKDSVDKALLGDKATTAGFVSIADNYGSTKAGNLASLYAAIAYMNKGEYEKAAGYLNSFSTDDDLLQARAYCLMGDAQSQLKKYDEAASYYQKAANANEDKRIKPEYLYKLGQAYEAKGDKDKAIAAYQNIVDNYKEYYDITTVRKYYERLKK